MQGWVDRSKAASKNTHPDISRVGFRGWLSGIRTLRSVPALQVNLCQVALFVHGSTVLIDFAFFERYGSATNPAVVGIPFGRWHCSGLQSESFDCTRERGVLIKMTFWFLQLSVDSLTVAATLRVE